MNKSCFKVFLGNYQKSMSGIFLIFYMKLQQHKDLKSWRKWLCFLREGEKHFFEVFCQKGPKMKCLRYYIKRMHETFQIFYMKLQQHKGLNLNELLFAKHFILKFWGEKKGPKWTFSSFVKNQCRKLFRFFCVKIKQHKGFKLTKNGLFRKNLALGF